MATLWKLSTKRYLVQQDEPLNIAGSKVQNEKGEDELAPKMFKLPILSPTRYELHAEASRYQQAPSEPNINNQKLLELPEIPFAPWNLDNKRASTLQKVIKILKNSVPEVENEVPNYRVAIPVTYGQKLPEVDPEPERDKRENVIYASEEGFHPRSKSPTYQTLCEANKRLRRIISKNSSWSVRTPNGAERFGQPLILDEIPRECEDFLKIEPHRSESSKMLPPSPEEKENSLEYKISKIEEKIEFVKKREITSIYTKSKAKANKNNENDEEQNCSHVTLSPRRHRSVSIPIRINNHSVTERKGQKLGKTPSCKCDCKESCLHKINFNNLSGWDSGPSVKSSPINNYVKKVKSATKIDAARDCCCPGLIIEEHIDMGYYSH